MSSSDIVPVLTSKQEDKAERAAVQIRKLTRRLVSDIVEIGHILIAVKDSLPHGRYLPWLKESFGWTERTASNFVNVAERIGAKAKWVSHLHFATIYRLAAPGTPDDYREGMLARLEGGDRVLDSEINSQLKQLRRAASGQIQEEDSTQGKLPRSKKSIKAHKQMHYKRDTRDHQCDLQGRQGARSSAAALIMEALEEEDFDRFIGFMDIAETLHRSDFSW